MKLSQEHSQIATIVAAYWFVSISMVYLNKFLMSNANLSVPAPLFVTWSQCVITALVCYAAGEIGDKVRSGGGAAYGLIKETSSDGSSGKGSSSFWHQFPKQEYKIGQGQRIFPLSLIFIGMIICNNLCLKWVEVSFYNVARSLTICCNVFFSSLLLGSHTSPKTMGCLAIVIVGFFIGSSGELSFSLRGTVAGMLASLFVSLNSIFTKKLLSVVDNDHWKLTFYNNVNASFLFLPLILLFEHKPLYDALGQQFLYAVFWLAMLIAGIFGFLIGIVTVLQIKHTSPLTHNISGTAKAAVQSILAFYIWKNEPTFLGVLGIFVVLGGSLLYTVVKMEEGKKASKKVESSSQPDVPPDDKGDGGDADVEANRPLKSGVN